MQTPPDSALGDFDGAFSAAPVKLDVEYTTPTQIHAQMEPHATIASWEGDKVVLYTANQMLNRGQKSLAAVLKLPVENVRLVSRYIGGGFGSKLQPMPEATLAALASKAIRRPVKVALTRQQEFHVATHRTDTIQRIRLGADRDGKLAALAHESWSATAQGDEFFETSANVTRSLYAAPNRITRHRLAKLDLPIASSMRAPGEAVGMLAFECAMDELAEQLGIDPIELRIRNEPTEDPEKQVPFSVRQLVPCMREGARRFGWERRGAAGTTRDGNWMVGMGMSAAARLNPLMPSSGLREARGRRHPHGADGHDRHRHRHLHDPRADRRGDDGVADRTHPRGDRGHRLPGGLRLGRLVRRGLGRLGALRRLRGVARQARGGRRTSTRTASSSATDASPRETAPSRWSISPARRASRPTARSSPGR